MNLPLIAAIGTLVLGVLVVIAVLWRWHQDSAIEFDLRYALVDGVTGRISIEKVAFMGTFLVMCWGFIAQVLGFKVDVGYATLMCTTFGATRVLSQAIAAGKDVMKPPETPK